MDDAYTWEVTMTVAQMRELVETLVEDGENENLVVALDEAQGVVHSGERTTSHVVIKVAG